MLGKTIADFTDATGVLTVPQYFVKSPVFPFNKFPGVDPTLGPEMRSTGEVMGVGENFGEAFAKAQLSAGTPLPDKGRVFISVNDRDKPVAVALAKRFHELGFEVTATRGTAEAIRAAGVPSKTVFKVNEGRPNAVDLLKAGSHRSDHLHRHQRRPRLHRRKSHPPKCRDLSHPLHHHHERRARRPSKPSPPAAAIPCAYGACRKSTASPVRPKLKLLKRRGNSTHERHRIGGRHRKPLVPAHQNHQQTSAADLRQADDLLPHPDARRRRDSRHPAGHRRPQLRRFSAPARQRQGIRTQASELRLPGRRRRHRRRAGAGRTLCRRRQDLRDPGRQHPGKTHRRNGAAPSRNNPPAPAFCSKKSPTPSASA